MTTDSKDEEVMFGTHCRLMTFTETHNIYNIKIMDHGGDRFIEKPASMFRKLHSRFVVKLVS